ncbi:MAG: phosphatase PAP2 family protein [Bacteroidota bacterium]|nr:phosphatase PAP2 family protein [Bacteroidota bacterium]MDP4230826.1 phosphatase PAP2 family protein [Bacteroidota bacterium]MDP4237335.1 phosphatase PAP2 family protein [Bacteroidota bacterium]
MNSISNPLLPFLLPLFLFALFWVLFYYGFPGLWRGMKFGAQKLSVLIVRSGLKKWSDANPRVKGLALYLPMVMILVVGGLAAFGAGKFFGDLGQSFRLTDSKIYHIDQAVNLWFRSERFPGLSILFRTMTDIGGGAGMTTIAVVITVLLVRKERASAMYMAITSAGGFSVNIGLKLLYARARPDVATAIAVAQGNSFPSGHAMGSFIILGAVAYLLLRQRFTWKWKSILLAMIGMLIVLVGLSRVYLGVHWSSDIIAGWCAGVVWLASTTIAFEVLLRIRQIRRGQRLSGAGKDIPDQPIAPAVRLSPGIHRRKRKLKKM